MESFENRCCLQSYIATYIDENEENSRSTVSNSASEPATDDSTK